MFTKKITAFLAVNLLLCSFNFIAAMQDDEATRGKCKKFNSLTVCNSVTAKSFITPEGPLFNGLRNWAVLTNQAAVGDGDNVLWAATPAGNISPGITVDPATGIITLPTSGIFLVQYSVQFDKTPFNGSSVGIAQLQQTVAGTPTDLTQATIQGIGATDTVAAATPLSSEEVTGYALITTTSTLNNVINLVISFSNGITFPFSTSDVANAQMTILQLN